MESIEGAWFVNPGLAHEKQKKCMEKEKYHYLQKNSYQDQSTGEVDPNNLSGQPGLNQRPLEIQSNALPLSYVRVLLSKVYNVYNRK